MHQSMSGEIFSAWLANVWVVDEQAALHNEKIAKSVITWQAFQMLATHTAKFVCANSFAIWLSTLHTSQTGHLTL